MENPVLLKELRTRLRSRQAAPVRWSVGLAAAAVILMSYHQAISAMMRDASTDTAKGAWTISLFLQSTLIWLLCPALAANAVTQEREQQTWDMLVFSLLTPIEILSAKFLVRLLPMFALLVTFVPFNLFCLVMGGVGFGDLLLAYLVSAVWIFFMTTVSLFMSWAFHKTAAAIAMSYVVLFALVVGTALLEYTFGATSHSAETPIIWLNPFRICMALVDATDFRAGSVILLSSVTFLSIGVFLFWRMVTQFRAFSVD